MENLRDITYAQLINFQDTIQKSDFGLSLYEKAVFKFTRNARVEP